MEGLIMTACYGFGTTAQVERFCRAFGFGSLDDPEDFRAAREMIASERERRGLSNEAPFSAQVSAEVLLVHADESITSPPFGPADWAIVHRHNPLVKRAG